MTDHSLDATETVRALRVSAASAGDKRYRLSISRLGREWHATVCIKTAPNCSDSVASFKITGPDTAAETQPLAELWLTHQCRDEQVRFKGLSSVSTEKGQLTATVEFSAC